MSDDPQSTKQLQGVLQGFPALQKAVAVAQPQQTPEPPAEQPPEQSVEKIDDSDPDESKHAPFTRYQRTAWRSRPTRASFERHQRKCSVCNNFKCEQIENFFVRWHRPYWLAKEFEVPLRAIYRHAEALGLFEVRRANLRAVLEIILEQASEARVTGESIIRAVRAYTCLTDNNQWVEPANRVIVSAEHPQALTANFTRVTKHARPRQTTGKNRAPLTGTLAIRNRRK